MSSLLLRDGEEVPTKLNTSGASPKDINHHTEHSPSWGGSNPHLPCGTWKVWGSDIGLQARWPVGPMDAFKHIKTNSMGTAQANRLIREARRKGGPRREPGGGSRRERWNSRRWPRSPSPPPRWPWRCPCDRATTSSGSILQAGSLLRLPQLVRNRGRILKLGFRIWRPWLSTAVKKLLLWSLTPLLPFFFSSPAVFSVALANPTGKSELGCVRFRSMVKNSVLNFT